MTGHTKHRIPASELPYRVDAVDVVAEVAGLIVSEFTLSPGQEVPWHYHSNVTDTFYCLSGCTSVRYGPRARALLDPGESIVIPSGTPHQVQSHGEKTCRFLIVQGIGVYDFVPIRTPDDSTRD